MKTRATRPTTLKGLRRKEGQRDRGTEGQKRRGKWPSFEITRLGLSVVLADLAYRLKCIVGIGLVLVWNPGSGPCTCVGGCRVSSGE